MRLWSLHPQYLDSKGLVALWREALLAQKVLAGKTLGYRHHPQLDRFRESKDPLQMIGNYLASVAEEADQRGYRFDQSKILRYPGSKVVQLKVTQGQLAFEFSHLLKKLAIRDKERFEVLKGQLARLRPHPLFKKIPGDIEVWERL